MADQILEVGTETVPAPIFGEHIDRAGARADACDMKLLEFESVSLAVDEFGDKSAPPVLLIAGATQSMDWWTPDFCERLAAEGLYVIRYDQRDTGASTASPPGRPAYEGIDLANDPIRILDALGVDAAHLVGLSMGGGIAQYLGVTAPQRVRTLTLIESSPMGGDPGELPPPDSSLTAAENELPVVNNWNDASTVIDYRVEAERPYRGSFGFDEDRIRAIATIEFGRAKSIESSLLNHFLVAGETHADPSAVTMPTLVIHSDSDPLFPLPHGLALARMIPRATLLRVNGMGHEAPPPKMWDVVIPAIVDHVGRYRENDTSESPAPPKDENATRGVPTWLTETRTSYDVDASGYAEEVQGLLDVHPHLRAHLDVFAELVQRDGGGRVADVGCGPGYVTRYLHDAGVEAFGIDLSPAMITLAQRVYPDLHFEVGTMTSLDLAAHSVAGIVAFWSTIHIPDHTMAGVMKEFHRVLLPGGHVLVGFHVGDSIKHATNGYAGQPISVDTHLRQISTMSDWLREANFQVESESVFRPDDNVPGAIVLARRHR
ncbi:alpha/beta fold hydrolase [Gordonia sp. MP11Mi]|uniref:Aminoacrylate hydrolase RutD n=1 Tax=Gordonia sp. MP11Mi TaxID=3022769 RepID=A0AA97GUS9_9ACTN